MDDLNHFGAFSLHEMLNQGKFIEIVIELVDNSRIQIRVLQRIAKSQNCG